MIADRTAMAVALLSLASLWAGAPWWVQTASAAVCVAIAVPVIRGDLP
ncbi:hypothetical protein UA75_31065 (plasmid) [Actinoalloteichus sp. GBA129-24]|nr:hypothetical protein UA75_14585 [Actinoalloteichus sp. GBA129-24]APU24176.1 hypothetical protein UA75_31065 [Actinoalloteichus sp. GBA129-24]